MVVACNFCFVHALTVTFQIETPDVSSEDRESKMFPSQHPLDMNITTHALTTDFLIYASSVSDSSSVEIIEM